MLGGERLSPQFHTVELVVLGVATRLSHHWQAAYVRTGTQVSVFRVLGCG